MTVTHVEAMKLCRMSCYGLYRQCLWDYDWLLEQSCGTTQFQKASSILSPKINVDFINGLVSGRSFLEENVSELLLYNFAFGITKFLLEIYGVREKIDLKNPKIKIPKILPNDFPSGMYKFYWIRSSTKLVTSLQFFFVIGEFPAVLKKKIASTN